MVHHPQRGLRNAGRKLAELDAVELVHVHLREKPDVEHVLPGSAVNRADHLHFEQPQFPVGDDEEVAAAAGRVEESKPSQFLLEAPQVGKAAAVLAGLEPGELGPQVVQEQRLDDLQDVLLGGVVGALGAALLGVHDRLEQRPEDGRGDVGPVEAAGVQQRPAHRRGEGGDAQRAAKQVAVDVGKARQVVVQRAGALGLRRIEHLEELRQPRPKVGAVFARSRLDEVEEDVARLEDAGVVGEQAEDDAHQEAFQVVALVARGGERVVQPADQFGGLDVGRVLIVERAALHAEDEAELFDVGVQLGEGKGGGVSFVEVVQLEGLEVADQDVAGALVLRQGIDVGPGLLVGAGEVAPGAFLLDDQDAGPEQVDEPPAVIQLRHVRLIARDGAALDSEYPEEVVVEALRLALLVGRLPPLVGEGGGTDANLVPGQAHGVSLRACL